MSSRCLEEFLPYWNYGHLESMNSDDYTTDRQIAGMCEGLTLLELKPLLLELVLKYVFKIISRVSKVFLGFLMKFW